MQGMRGAWCPAQARTSVMKAHIQPPDDRLRRGAPRVLLAEDDEELRGLLVSVLREHGWADLKPWWRSAQDGHPNPDGQRFIADRLVDHVRGDARLAAIFGL